LKNRFFGKPELKTEAPPSTRRARGPDKAALTDAEKRRASDLITTYNELSDCLGKSIDSLKEYDDSTGDLPGLISRLGEVIHASKGLTEFEQSSRGARFKYVPFEDPSKEARTRVNSAFSYLQIIGK